MSDAALTATDEGTARRLVLLGRARAQTSSHVVFELAKELEVNYALLDDLYHLGDPNDLDDRDEIDALYARLSELAAGPSTPETEQTYAVLMERLRALQGAEVEEMTAAFQRRSALPDGLVDRVLARARDLLNGDAPSR